MDGILEGANVQEVAAPDVTDNQDVSTGSVEESQTDESVVEESTEQKEVQSPEVNAQ